MADSYKHPRKLTRAEAMRVARGCLNDGQSFAFVSVGSKWVFHCPKSDKERAREIIDDD